MWSALVQPSVLPSVSEIELQHATKNPRCYRPLLPHQPFWSCRLLQGDAYELYKQQFDERYGGNRAPLGLYIHAAWIIADPT